MLLKQEYQGTKNLDDIMSFWARDLSVEQCAQETGLDVVIVTQYYELYSKEFDDWCSK